MIVAALVVTNIALVGMLWSVLALRREVAAYRRAVEQYTTARHAELPWPEGWAGAWPDETTGRFYGQPPTAGSDADR